MEKNKSQFGIEELTRPNHGMKRDMGLFRAVGLMAGLMIGSGIFYVGVYVLDYINVSTGWALVAWILAGLVSLCAGLCYACLLYTSLRRPEEKFWIDTEECLLQINSYLP